MLKELGYFENKISKNRFLVGHALLISEET
jgi:hypothetical protein